MMEQLLALLAVIVLCSCWAVFQIWLSRHDPEANQCLRNCGSCSCKRAEDTSQQA